MRFHAGCNRIDSPANRERNCLFVPLIFLRADDNSLDGDVFRLTLIVENRHDRCRSCTSASVSKDHYCGK